MIEIQEPSEGKVTLELTWDEAEILLRAVGMTNLGNLESVSPDLASAVDSMVDLFGRNNTNECRRYLSEIRNGQVYVIDLQGHTHS